VDSSGLVSITDPVQTSGGVITVSGSDIMAEGVTLSSASFEDPGGDISLIARSGSISTGNLDSFGTSSGNVSVEAVKTITTGEIDASGSGGDGGNVTLDPLGNIEISYINAQGGSGGSGGLVDITTASLFRAVGGFADRNGILASISTVGGTGGGPITIRHGGSGKTAFTVGRSAINGTAGAISSGTSTISPVKIFPFSFVEGNIQIIGVNEPPPDEITAVQRPGEKFPEAQKPSYVALPLPEIEEHFTEEYQNHLTIEEKPIRTLDEIRGDLLKIEGATGVKPALIYTMFMPAEALQSGEDSPNSNHDQLELILVTSKGLPVRQLVAGATRDEVLDVADQFRNQIRKRRSSKRYLPAAKQLYQWFVSPLSNELQAQEINNLVFIMDSQLRSLPLAALHDGSNFIIKSYSVGLMPSLSLSDTRYTHIKDLWVLAMGASQFSYSKRLNPLPAVTNELEEILALWPGEILIDQYFTKENLQASLSTSQPFGMLHLATHANFQPGTIENSFIALWDGLLNLIQLQQLDLRLHDPPLELMTLSACRTALGDREAELGFTGVATQAGVKSTLGSLWKVSDVATHRLMRNFYERLKDPSVTIKAEALRQAQLSMLNVEAQDSVKGMEHPHSWSGFTMVGSPW
jgi:CHAT domain-containing protein